MQFLIDATRGKGSIKGRMSGEPAEMAALAERLLDGGWRINRLTWWEIRQSDYATGCFLCRARASTKTPTAAAKWTKEHACPTQVDSTGPT